MSWRARTTISRAATGCQLCRNFLLGLVVAGVLLGGRRSARVRDWCSRVGRFRFVADMLYGAIYTVASAVLTLPLTIYEGFVREHDYEMATQTFGPWFGEQLIALGVNTVALALAVAILYAVIRRTGERWWIWGTVTATGFMMFMVLVGPVWVDPLFNTYKPVADPVVKSAVLAMAQADGVPVDNVYQFDASRQTTRVSANVSGILGSAAVRLNDNLLRATLPEIRAVMGHELGHFVMNHMYKMICEFVILIFVGFMFVNWAMARVLARHATRWGVKGVADTATFPLFIAVFSVFMFFATPMANTMVRVQEIEADRFGLRTWRASRWDRPKSISSWSSTARPIRARSRCRLFNFDHPSARNRIHDARCAGARRWAQRLK